MDSTDLTIRKAGIDDHEAIWSIIQPAIEAGDTLAFAPGTSREYMLDFWCNPKNHTYVAQMGDKVVGTFFIKDNQPGLGAHVANAGYITSKDHGGKGIGASMCEFSLSEAKKLGYTHMQFNIVIKSNERAVKLWQRMGFQVIGEIPEAFDHQQLGLTNAYIMWKKL